jgi:phosphate acetyltransferase
MSEITFTMQMREKAKALNFKVAYPDAEDERTIKTAIFVQNQGIAIPVLVGNKSKIEIFALAHGLSIEGIEIADPASSHLLKEFATILFEKRKKKGMTEEEAIETMKNPLYFAGYLLEKQLVRVVVGGNVSSTGDVIRASLFSVGTAPGISIVSSFFVMVKEEKMLCFGDCAVNPNPDPKQLADIAISTAKNFNAITGQEPRIAMLSFSTNGSASHELVDKVKEATALVKEKAPELPCDGEMQLDAAIIPSIGERKFPGSHVAGKANVLIFPDLNAGNIGYKLTERLAGYEAVGPIVQGLAKPYCDLSRGCSVDDMINVTAICSLMA